MLEELKAIESHWEVNLCTCKPTPINLQNYGRDDLAELFRHLGLNNGAEIGVERGHFSRTLCKANPHLQLMAVDAWQAYPDYREHVTQAKLDGFLEETRQRLAPYSVNIVKGFSVDVAKTVPDGSLDFVYLDANHTFDQVLADIEAWSPKVRSGGIVSGHDYIRRKRMNYGVKEAVQQFTHTHHIQSWAVLRADTSPSWFWVQK